MRGKEYSSNTTALAVVVVVLLITQIGASYACFLPERQAFLNFKRCKACDNLTRHVVMLDLNDPCSDSFTDSNLEPLLSDVDDICPLLHIHAVPEFLSSMQRLRYLSLQGGEGDAIPIPSSGISNLTNLRALYFDDFTFTNLTASTWLAPLSSLQYIGLKDMDLPMNLYKVLNMLPSLLHLYLPYCNFAKVSSFPLTNLACLQLLILHAFQNTTSIKVLDISVNLHNLVKLDLSSNRITVIDPLRNLTSIKEGCGFAGKLPSTLHNMTSIRSLDFSQNSLSLIVPFGKLENFVELNLEGSIPVENQFQTLNDPFSYTGNQYLCGAPLPKYCPGPHHVPIFEGYEDEDRKNNQLEKALFYSIVSLVFATGFWLIIGFLYFKNNWRYACFEYVEKVADRIYDAVVILKKMMQRNKIVVLLDD
ncbi:LRR receptor-like serine/threonine-protein kinase [Arachis hypogaea]|nr:LRR receptor-like serine/threonine-protein kinase [Arachis hypogaea]